MQEQCVDENILQYEFSHRNCQTLSPAKTTCIISLTKYRGTQTLCLVQFQLPGLTLSRPSPADLDTSLRLGVAAGISAVSVLALMLFRMSKNLLLCGVQRDLIGPLPFNCRCLSRLLQVGVTRLGRAARGMAFVEC